jgi:hypothetical protein
VIGKVSATGRPKATYTAVIWMGMTESKNKAIAA